MIRGKRTQAKKSVGMGVGGVRRNCSDGNDEIIQNLTRDNEYDNSKRELMGRKRLLTHEEHYDYVDADDEDKYDSDQVGAGKYPRGGKYSKRNHSQPPHKYKLKKSKPKKPKKSSKKPKKKASGGWSGKKNKNKQKGICKPRHMDKWVNDIFS